MARKTKSQEFLEFIEEEETTVQSELPPVEADFVEESDNYGEWYSYTRIQLSELEDGDEYEGKPMLLPVESIQFDDEEQPKYRARLLLIDDEAEEYLQINLNLKKNSEVQENIHSASSLYALIGGIQNLFNPQWTTLFNHIKTEDLVKWREYIDSKESMTVVIVEKSGSFTYNSFRVTSLD